MGAAKRVSTSEGAGLSTIIAGMIICSYAPPEVNTNYWQGSDFIGAGVISDEQSAGERQPPPV